MGAALCRDIDNGIILSGNARSGIRGRDWDKNEDEHLPTLVPIERSKKIHHRDNPKVDHTESIIIEEGEDSNRENFREELNCTWCSNKKVIKFPKISTAGNNQELRVMFIRNKVQNSNQSGNEENLILTKRIVVFKANDKVSNEDVMKGTFWTSRESDSLSPVVDTIEACNKAAARLRDLANNLEHGEVPRSVLQKTIQYAACVLDSVSMDETKKRPVSVGKRAPIRTPSEPSPIALTTANEDKSVDKSTIKSVTNSKQWNRKLLEDEDDLCEVQTETVPNEVREWLASTFTKSNAQKKRTEDKPKFRSVANAIRAGIMVDRIYRRLSNPVFLQITSEVANILKTIDDWSFDVFSLNEACNGQVLKILSCELLNRYGLLSKFKISSVTMENYFKRIEKGYVKHDNPYHNNLHAADVTQTVHYNLWVAGLAQWLTDVEIFATIIAAIIHDYQHTGTTNNFHVMTNSEISLTYNDRAVLENFHISAAFKELQEEDCNFLANFNREEYREFRNLVIDMVLATDMSTHFQQIKSMKTILNHSEFNVDKPKGLSLILHCSDISHPSKKFKLHYRWTHLLMEEFFRQGDREKELGLPYSPLCDRNTTLIAESQIGFIDFIVAPTLEVCGDLLDKIQLQVHGNRPLLVQSDIIAEEKLENTDDQRPKSTSAVRSLQRNVGSVDSELSRKVISAPSSRLPSSMDQIRITKIERPWLECLEENKVKWQEKAALDAMLKAEQSIAELNSKSKTEATSVSTPESEL